ncbi:hypothetical protein [Moraxella lacunata]
MYVSIRQLLCDKNMIRGNVLKHHFPTIPYFAIYARGFVLKITIFHKF